MDWNVCRISIPVFDIIESKDFYDFILDVSDYNLNKFQTENECFVTGGNCELKLYRLKNSLKNDKFQSRKCYPTIAIKNLNKIIRNLKNKEIQHLKSIYSNEPLITSIVIQESSLNYLELIDYKNFPDEKNKLKPYKWSFHHINLESYNVRSSVDYITQFLQIREGTWKAPETIGDVNIDKTQLSIFPTGNHHEGLHINKADFTFSWRNSFIHNPTIGGHPAFTVKDIESFMVKLEKNKIAFTDAKIYAMPNIHQVYLYDPNANIIEINQLIS